MVLLSLAVGFALGWYVKPSGEHDKWVPDKIKLYYEGEQKEVTRTEQPEYFDGYYVLIDFEKADMMSGGNPPVTEDDIEEMKKSAVEYVYDNPVSIEINTGDGIETIQFTSILFPVEEKWNGANYIRTTDSTYLYMNSRPNLGDKLRRAL